MAFEELLNERREPSGCSEIQNPVILTFKNPRPVHDIELVVLVPVNPKLGKHVLDSCRCLVQRSTVSFRLCRLVFDSAGLPPPPDKPHPYRQEALAKIRQDMVDKYLGTADWVAWVDADIVDYPANLFSELIRRAGGGIAAPVLLMEGELGSGDPNDYGFEPGRFFDVAGYVEGLRWARFDEPWFDQPGPQYWLDSVGSCYVVNAEIYRKGARHIADPYSLDFIRRGLKWSPEIVKMNQKGTANCFTEHFTVCQWAKQHGFPVRAYADLVARHANSSQNHTLNSGRSARCQDAPVIMSSYRDIPASDFDNGESTVRAIAFHLPQFHPIPENDQWWGKGFTEWANVAKAKPRFKGHYQPHLPADLGFYDLRLPEARAAQAELAAAYGIYGFCYYHYWFNGRQLLERPVNEIWRSGEPAFPFCLCWANENWTRRWDGLDQEILLEQHYSPGDDLAHIRALIPLFSDSRYIRVLGKPLLAVYTASKLPQPLKTTEIWRDEAARAGLKGLFLARVESHSQSGDPRKLGFDCSLQFHPGGALQLGRIYRRNWWHRVRLGTAEVGLHQNYVHDYEDMMEKALAQRLPPYPRIPCVCPGWDNSPRRESGANIFVNSTPQRYEFWLREVVNRLQSLSQPIASGISPDSLVFINAWNEWAEGNHLEPCQRWGRAYLEATKRALGTQASKSVKYARR